MTENKSLKEEIIEELYELYKEKVEEATDMFKSEWSYSQKMDEDRDKEDKEELEYFESLLNKLRLILYKKN